MFTSDALTIGQVYTRDDLKRQFGIVDATLLNGVFRPKGHDSVWLFVTERKSADRTQYADKLDGDMLHWDGQTKGRTDLLIMEHERRGLELLLFYRRRKYEFAGAGFRYCGRFRYVSHSGSQPTHFLLERVKDIDALVADDLAAWQAEESYIEGRSSSVLVNRYERDPRLRAAAIHLHGTKCQVCGFDFAAVYGAWGDGFIEVHHLRPLSSYEGEVEIDPVTDMAVLCANCHRMVHRKQDHPLSLEELRLLRTSCV